MPRDLLKTYIFTIHFQLLNTNSGELIVVNPLVAPIPGKESPMIKPKTFIFVEQAQFASPGKNGKCFVFSKYLTISFKMLLSMNGHLAGTVFVIKLDRPTWMRSIGRRRVFFFPITITFKPYREGTDDERSGRLLRNKNIGPGHGKMK